MTLFPKVLPASHCADPLRLERALHFNRATSCNDSSGLTRKTYTLCTLLCLQAALLLLGVVCFVLTTGRYDSFSLKERQQICWHPLVAHPQRMQVWGANVNNQSLAVPTRCEACALPTDFLATSQKVRKILSNSSSTS